MFDPFGDFETAGYLRNFLGEKDLDIVKHMEHLLFTSNYPKAKQYLSGRQFLEYDDFLKTHEILFAEFYPWAGQDRTITAPNKNISKAKLVFAEPTESVLAINEALRLGQQVEKLPNQLGTVMGLFAYGHPFLDGNGRTMLVIHMELCRRAGYSMAWGEVDNAVYLSMLTYEIVHATGQPFNRYLQQFLIKN